MRAAANATNITLFSPYYTAKTAARQAELKLCLRHNLENQEISQIVLLIDDGSAPPIKSDKLTVINVPTRPTYGLWLDLTQKYAHDGISVLANSDIHYDDTIAVLSKVLSTEHTFVALSRYEHNGEALIQHRNAHWSQDTWAIRGGDSIPEPLRRAAEIPMGIPRCDNRIAYLFALHGWRVFNPCDFIRSYHQHHSMERSYDIRTDRSIMGAVAYIYPSKSVEDESDVWIDLWLERDDMIRNLTINNSFSMMREAESEEAYWTRQDDAIWQSNGRFIRALSHSRRLYVWGAGSSGQRCLRLLARADLVIHGVIDNDTNKQGSLCEEVPVVAPSILLNPPETELKPFIFVASMYSREIMSDLRKMGKLAEVDFLDIFSEHELLEQENEQLSLILQSETPITINEIFEVSPIVDVSPICITDRPDGFGHDHFWQYPCATERQAHENHKTIGIGVNIDESNKEAHTYLGLPWATYIDRKLPYLKEFDYIAGRLADLKSQCRTLGYKLHIHTVCQHIHWQRIADWFKKLEVTDLHLSHCECRLLKDGDPWPYLIHSWPLIAASIEGLDVLAVNENLKPIAERLYLASFIGAQMPHYRSNVRLLLQKEFCTKKETDVLFELRDEWHFNKVVYEEQVAGRKLNRVTLEKQHAGMSRYNQIISNSIYSLCPEGAGPNTLRIWESLALGATPIIIADDWAPPLIHGSDLQLEDCCVFIKSNEIDGLLEKLRSYDPARLQQMQYSGKKLYEAFKSFKSFLAPALQEETT